MAFRLSDEQVQRLAAYFPTNTMAHAVAVEVLAWRAVFDPVSARGADVVDRVAQIIAPEAFRLPDEGRAYGAVPPPRADQTSLAEARERARRVLVAIRVAVMGGEDGGGDE